MITIEDLKKSYCEENDLELEKCDELDLEDLWHYSNENYNELDMILNSISTLGIISDIDNGLWFIYHSEKLKKSIVLSYEDKLRGSVEDVLIIINQYNDEAIKLESSITVN